MGGYFSGRIGWRIKCENALSIDVRRWARGGYLRGNGYFGWQWTLHDDQKSNIGVWVRDNHIELECTKDNEPIRYSVRLDWTPCNIGGRRVWFRCPLVGCHRRAAKLYLGSRYFGCRRCYKLIYQSQCDDTESRLGRKLRKLENKLNPDGSKPRYMHWRTYEKLCARVESIAERKDDAFSAYLVRWMGRFGITPSTN